MEIRLHQRLNRFDAGRQTLLFKMMDALRHSARNRRNFAFNQALFCVYLRVAAIMRLIPYG